MQSIPLWELLFNHTEEHVNNSDPGNQHEFKKTSWENTKLIQQIEAQTGNTAVCYC